MCAGCAVAAFAKPGIKSIVVFGDSLSDAGNVPLWWDYMDIDPDPTLSYLENPFFYGGRASNGPVWIEAAAWAYGYDVSKSLAGGTNFAFAGAESGSGLSDQNTPNFHTQIGMWQQAVMNETIAPPMPWQLFVVWFGANDVFRMLLEIDDLELPPDPELAKLMVLEAIQTSIQSTVMNIAGGITAIHEAHGRMFLVPNMPPLHRTPWGSSGADISPDDLELISTSFNAALEQALQYVESMHDKVTILRLNVYELMNDFIDNKEFYDLENVTDAALFDIIWGLGQIPPVLIDPNSYLFWDILHPTGYTHSALAQKAMDIIPIGSWWGHAKARGPDGNALLGMGWINDSHWPWVYSYGMDGGQWMWIIEESGSPDGYIALVPKGYKWIFINYRTGEFYDYSTGKWSNEP